MELTAVEMDYYSHLLCLHVDWDLVLGIHKQVEVQDTVQQGTQGQGSHCSLGPQQPQLDRDQNPHEADGLESRKEQ